MSLAALSYHDPRESPTDRLLSRLESVKPRGTGFIARCPAHDDGRPSLKIDEAENGDCLINCYAGCKPADVVAKIGLELADLFHKEHQSSPKLIVRDQGHRITYDYHDADGVVLFQEVRDPPKRFWLRRPNGNGGWVNNLDGIDPVLYRLPELLASPGRWIALTEGAKDADRLRGFGFLATTAAKGANSPWLDTYSETLRGRSVMILADNDAAGIACARTRAQALFGIAKRVKVLLLPDLPQKADVSDWLDNGHTKADLLKVMKATADWSPASPEPLLESEDETSSSLVVSPFPHHVLPPAFRTYCEAAAISIGVPVEMVAMPLLAFLGSTIGNRLYIQLKRGYRQYATLYLAIVADVGAAKSPALSAAQWPVDILQKEAHALYKAALTEFERDLEAWKVKDQAIRGDKPIRPKLRHFFSTNLTLEALVSILEVAPGIAIIRDEVVSFIKSMDQYRAGIGSDRQEYLSLHACAPIKADRRTGEAVYAARPVACIVGGIQPDVFPTFHNATGQRDGMLERFIPIVPTIGLRQWTEDDIDPALLDSVVDIFRELNRLSPLDEGDGGLCMQLHPDARQLWVDWYDENARLQFETKGVLNGYYSKLSNHVARFTLILNAAWNPQNPNVLVSPQPMTDAIDLGEWIRQNIHAVMPLLGESGTIKRTGIHSRILRVLRTAPEPHGEGWVQRGVILQKLGNVKTDDLEVSLRYLEADGQIEHRRDPASTTKPAEQWRIIPVSTVEDSRYSKNPPSKGYTPGDSSNTSNSSTVVPFSRRSTDDDGEEF